MEKENQKPEKEVTKKQRKMKKKCFLLMDCNYYKNKPLSIRKMVKHGLPCNPSAEIPLLYGHKFRGERNIVDGTNQIGNSEIEVTNVDAMLAYAFMETKRQMFLNREKSIFISEIKNHRLVISTFINHLNDGEYKSIEYLTAEIIEVLKASTDIKAIRENLSGYHLEEFEKFGAEFNKALFENALALSRIKTYCPSGNCSYNFKTESMVRHAVPTLVENQKYVKNKDIKKWLNGIDVRYCSYGDLETLAMNLDTKIFFFFIGDTILNSCNTANKYHFVGDSNIMLKPCISLSFTKRIGIVTNPDDLYALYKYGISDKDINDELTNLRSVLMKRFHS